MNGTLLPVLFFGSFVKNLNNGERRYPYYLVVAQEVSGLISSMYGLTWKDIDGSHESLALEWLRRKGPCPLLT